VMTPLFREWESYNREVLDVDAGEIQRIETRNAFYAGAVAILALLDEGADKRSLREEINAWHADYKARYGV
jgi:hypothetical protein